MIKYLKYILVVCTVLLCAEGWAQEDPPEKEVSDKITIRPAPFSVRLDFSVPNPTNAAWRKCMTGVIDANAGLDLRIAGNLLLGVGYKAALMYVPPKYFLEVHTKMQMHCAYVSLGYDIYKSNTFFITPSLNAGYCFTKYTGVEAKSTPIPAGYKPSYGTSYVEPQFALTWMAESRVGLGIHTSFVLMNKVWDPKFIFMQDWVPLGGVNQQALTSYINLGFNIYLGIGKGKTRAAK